MRLIFEATGEEVKVGSRCKVNGVDHVVTYFRPPHKPSSSGKICVKLAQQSSINTGREYYVSVIGVKWIEREDQS